jgi:hypothetical protein
VLLCRLQLWAGLQSGKTPWDLEHPDEDCWTYFRNNPELEKVRAGRKIFLRQVSSSDDHCQRAV